ncbi:MAG: transposase [Thermoanaerobaculia bacterium]|nr:transposase [Thermoanaerobaculia bacterium]
MHSSRSTAAPSKPSTPKHCFPASDGLSRKTRRWRRTRRDYLFPGPALARVLRAKLYHEIERRGLKLPSRVPKEWIVDCRHVGRGDKALEYLSRYLYRGVISEANILLDRDGCVTFRFTDWQSQVTGTETLSGADFLWRVLQHVLPRGFHRVRDYGLLHHNARKLLRLIQYILGVRIVPSPSRVRPQFQCSVCGGAMETVGVFRPEVARWSRTPGLAACLEGNDC